MDFESFKKKKINYIKLVTEEEKTFKEIIQGYPDFISNQIESLCCKIIELEEENKLLLETLKFKDEKKEDL